MSAAKARICRCAERLSRSRSLQNPSAICLHFSVEALDLASYAAHLCSLGEFSPAKALFCEPAAAHSIAVGA